MTQPATLGIAVGPAALNDSANTTYQTPASGNLAGNDSYPAGATFSLETPPAHGVVTGLGATNGAYTYTPVAGYSGPDSFTYRLCLAAPHDGLCASASVALTVAAPIIPPELRLETSVSSNQPAVGLPFTYTLTLSNSGGPTTIPVQVVDNLPAGVRVTGLAVPPGWTCAPAITPQQPLQGGMGVTLSCDLTGAFATGSQTLRLTAVPTAASGSYTNQATVTGDGQSPKTTTCDGSAPANCGQANITPANPRLDLVARVALAPTDELGTPDGRVQAGEKLTYTYTVTNRGDVSLTALEVADGPLNGPPSCASTTSQGKPFSPAAGLGVNDSVVCTAQRTVAVSEEATGQIDSAATALGRAPDGSPWLASATSAWNNAPLNAQLGLALSVVHNDADGDGAFDQGETVASNLVVRNLGKVAVNSLAATLADPLFPPFSCTPTDLAVGGQATCAAAEAVLTLADETAGRLPQTATATALDPNGRAVTATTPRILAGGQAAGLELRQAAVLSNDQGTPGLTAGDTLTYTLMATNTGGLALTNAAVTDDKLGAALQTAGACSPALGSTLNPGAGLVCSVAYTVQAGEATPIDNTAHASGKPTGRAATVEASSQLVLPYTAVAGPTLYSIGDRVWLDSGTGNGVLDASETGIDGVVVRLQVGTGSVWTQASFADGTPIPDQVTAGGGYYHFANVPRNSSDQRYRVAILPLNFKQDLSGTKPLYGASSSYVDDASPFPWTDGRDQGIGTGATATDGTLSRTFDLAALASGVTSLDSVDFGFAKATLVAPPDLLITNAASAATVSRNGTLTYTLQASNAVGAGSLSRAPVVLDSLPTGLTVATGWPTTQPVNWTCLVSANRQSVTCIFKGALPLAGGADIGGPIAIPVQVGASAPTGTATNKATITKMSGEPSFDNNAASATITVNP